ncbi:MAG: 16S rRNA (uracil(1498)-N(3))-methyltransferase [Nitrospira sp.]|jgi:16S rRNA (uracil1498-N3)-methyltransferase|nr:16S rRNA (uracil(1498)-N(3))-methyltransferase [Nitrospira sp.]MDH4243444.1 16S rRNA (uracil(1498)-N(3))-methyltransferase [Nitrospira sp.]MDH4357809.1 16S rRNA (uracil(1498)-N(3))-methyltransferase [Nitrospira sp.]MDH5316853.1 16S rRNA (uracil(1498)-N(3))-methyltransferase [Nitrospira sp.]
MPVFFVPSECISQQTISATGDVLVHLRDSLRIKVGEIVLFGDGAGRRYCTEVTAVTNQALTSRILETITQPAPKAPALILGQALLKGEKMDWVIQKATELGVSKIVPIKSQHSVVQLKADRVDHQLARWRRIVLEAAQQSEQWHVPKIAQPRSLSELLANHATSTTLLMLAERDEGKSLQTVGLPQGTNGSVLALVGPEGGWSKEEKEVAQQAGVETITLGQHILRSETAAMATISILQSRLGELG